LPKLSYPEGAHLNEVNGIINLEALFKKKATVKFTRQLSLRVQALRYPRSAARVLRT
jgi:hypothetical protein